MSRAARLWLLAVAGGGAAALMVWAVTGLPAYGSVTRAYASLTEQAAVGGRHVGNAVAAIVFDIRGVDTMGEELMLFAAALGVALLLREARDEDRRTTRDRARGAGLVALGRPAVGLTLAVGLMTVAQGYLTPGGGFQGGVALAAALALVFAALGLQAAKRVAPTPLLDAAEGFGAGTYVGVGIGAIAAGSVLFANVLPLGTGGTLAAGGTIPLLNAASGLEVTAAFSLVFIEFLEEVLGEEQGAGR